MGLLPGEQGAFSLTNTNFVAWYIIYKEVIIMSQHMSPEDRYTILNGLNSRIPLSKIAAQVK